jgi:predicted metal-dependent RNase
MSHPIKHEPAVLTFLGAAGTVTGSRFCLETADRVVLVDCGLYQGLKQLRLKNWEPWPFDLDSLDAVVLTHAHIDHSGYLPRLYKLGYRKPVFCSEGTAGLLEILLPDSARLQTEEAEYANRKGYSKHHPAEPLVQRGARARCTFVAASRSLRKRGRDHPWSPRVASPGGTLAGVGLGASRLG